MLKNKKISTRLTITFGLIIAAFIIVITVSFYGLNDLSDNTTKLYEHPFRVTNSVLRVKNGIGEINIRMYNLLNAKDAMQANQISQEIKIEEDKIQENFDVIETAFLGEKEKVDKARKLFEQWTPSRENIIKQIKEFTPESREKALLMLKNDEQNIISKIENSIKNIDDFAQEKALSFTKKSENEAFEIEMFLLLITVISIIFGIWISNQTNNRIKRPMKEIVHAAENISNGNFDIDLKIDSDDEFGELTKSFNRMINNLRKQVRLAGLVGEGKIFEAEKQLENAGKGELANALRNMVMSLKESVELAQKVANGELGYQTKNKLQQKPAIWQHL
jgi:methyl-accepting chemotaxis protein